MELASSKRSEDEKSELQRKFKGLDFFARRKEVLNFEEQRLLC